MQKNTKELFLNHRCWFEHLERDIIFLRTFVVAQKSCRYFFECHTVVVGLIWRMIQLYFLHLICCVVVVVQFAGYIFHFKTCTHFPHICRQKYEHSKHIAWKVNEHTFLKCTGYKICMPIQSCAIYASQLLNDMDIHKNIQKV